MKMLNADTVNIGNISKSMTNFADNILEQDNGNFHVRVTHNSDSNAVYQESFAYYKIASGHIVSGDGFDFKHINQVNQVNHALPRRSENVTLEGAVITEQLADMVFKILFFNNMMYVEIYDGYFTVSEYFGLNDSTAKNFANWTLNNNHVILPFDPDNFQKIIDSWVMIRDWASKYNYLTS